MAYDEILKAHPNLKELLPFLDTHNEESPRGQVLITAAFLEEQLFNVIAAFLVDGLDTKRLMTGLNAPLGTFSARILMAHALGLISGQERNELETIRKIRNQFAHNHRVTFEDDRVRDLCRNLTFLRNAEKIKPQGQFMMASISIVLKLVNRPAYVAEKRLSSRDWPY